ncbi:F-box/FBD/LRR-repeat protein At1g13570-like [Tasmannia lanceolata]|uniref:F-box/FBD/LRR-repeat protein At1g13570-like n=1 Tax=Tasmannia lanceolata TaxID=3420 RepID=UPI004063B7C2
MDVAQASAVDVISNLPRDAIDAILMRLPIKDVVRTSILSRKWRYMWVTIPQIVFNSQCYPRGIPSSNTALLNLKRVNIVDQVLLHHRGPIHKFECSDYLPPCSDLDRWMVFLSRQGIKELILNFYGGVYKLPACLFSCQELYHLRLLLCNFNIPPAFEGFRHLKILYLNEVVIPNDEFECLTSNFPLLESLTCIYYNVRLPRIKINSPNLQYLYLMGIFYSLCLENIPVLASANISACLVEEFTKHLGQGEICSFPKVLHSLHNVEKLELHLRFLQIFALGDVSETVPTTFKHLKNLSLHINFGNPNEILAALCVLRSSDHLQQLEIRVSLKCSTDPPRNYSWEAREHMDCMLNPLQTVKMIDMRWEKPELEFIKLLLIISPVLETLTIQGARKPRICIVKEESSILKELIRFRRTSSKAEIIYRG